MTWTLERALALAPDPASAKSGRDLANANKWKTLARNTDTSALWGECQGSGKLPYLTQIKLEGDSPSFKCSCPSRKFPCKHGLGLLLLYTQNGASFATTDAPSWVSEWLEKQQKRAESKERPKIVDQAAQAKRLKAREKKVATGLDDLSLWLRDLVRTGLASAPSKPYTFWETAAKRLIDAQAPGVARRVLELSQSLVGDDWTGDLLERLGLIHLLIEGYKRIDTLSPETQADIRATIGFSQSQDELNHLPGIRDVWQVYGQVSSQEERLRLRRTWLLGQSTGQTALLLEFAYAQQAFSTVLNSYEAYEGELVFYPSNYPQRASLKEGKLRAETEPKSFPGESLSKNLERYSEALAKQPWLEQMSFKLEALPVPFGNRWTLRDLDGYQVLVRPNFAHWPALLENSSGHPVGLFGEWDGSSFLPLMMSKLNQTFAYPHEDVT